MSQTYFSILTEAGEARFANATALGIAIKLTHMAVGDGAGDLPVPDRKQRSLVNETRRAPLNSLAQDTANPGQFVAEQVIPEGVGGWWIREIGLYDENGILCAVANCPPSYKPQLAEGSGRTQVVRMVFLVGSAEAVELKIDPSVVLATRQYCDSAIAAELDKRDSKQSVRTATIANLPALAGLLKVDAVALKAGDRVLVKDQTVGKENGIYVAEAGSWSRALDAASGVTVTPSMLVPVEEGATNADSLWQLTTHGAIVIGATPLAYQRVGAGHFATMEALQAAGSSYSDIKATSENTTLVAGDLPKYLYIANPGGFTITLPPAKTVRTGFRLFIVSNSGNNVIQRGNNSDLINLGLGSGTGVYNFTMAAGETIVLVANKAGGWYAESGTTMLRFAGMFVSSLGQNGYQKLPNGLILNWGQVAGVPAGGGVHIAFAATFPNGFLTAFASFVNSGGITSAAAGGWGNPSGAGMAVFNNGNAGASSISYLALGF